mmetsp:Transcript_5033/g.7633  ORF Transcript_5033/g.7633 Transcript_5033/m.7633 type:complete len:215 (-) Transcript_5033:83-727(-)
MLAVVTQLNRRKKIIINHNSSNLSSSKNSSSTLINSINNNHTLINNISNINKTNKNLINSISINNSTNATHKKEKVQLTTKKGTTRKVTKMVVINNGITAGEIIGLVVGMNMVEDQQGVSVMTKAFLNNSNTLLVVVLVSLHTEALLLHMAAVVAGVGTFVDLPFLHKVVEECQRHNGVDADEAEAVATTEVKDRGMVMMGLITEEVKCIPYRH